MRTIKVIIEKGKLWNVTNIGNARGGFIKLPDSGTASVLWDRDGDYEHVSVSPMHKFRTPTWDDMCFLKDIFFEDEEECYQIHPAKSQYVNLMDNCLHIWRRKDGKSLLDE